MLATDLMNPELQYGAFGLCVLILAFCVALWKSNQHERRELGKVIDDKERRIDTLSDRNAMLLSQNTLAMNRLSEALEVRPCLAGDRVFNRKKGEST